MPLVNELEEFRKQYSETIVRLREKKYGSQLFQPVYVQQEGAHSPQHLCVNHSSFGQIQVKWKSASYEWNTELPHRGLFNHKGAVGLFIRLPQRQWKRGLCPGTSKVEWITNNFRKDLNPITSTHVSLGDLSFVNALYDRTYRHWESVVADLLTFHTVEEALSPQFALTQSLFLGDDDVLLLWYEDQVVGELYPLAPGIVVRQAVFGQEIQDFVKRKKIGWPVKFIEM